MLINMKVARTKKNISQKDLAKQVGLTPSTVHNLESEKVDYEKMRYGTLKKIADYLQITVEELTAKELIEK